MIKNKNLQNIISNNLRLMLFAGGILCASCIQQGHSVDVITESRAIELAKAEFKKSGRKLEDYRTKSEFDSKGQIWIVWFIRDTKDVPVGGKHFVSVEKIGGKTKLMLGE